MLTSIVTYMYARYNFIYFEIFHDTVAMGVDLHVCIDSSNKSFNSTFAIHYKKLLMNTFKFEEAHVFAYKCFCVNFSLKTF